MDNTEYKLGLQKEYMARVAALNEGRGLKAYVLTFGCQQNEADSEKISGMLKTMGYTLTDDENEADFFIVNTCAVREHAELKALSITGQFKHIKERKPDVVIGICGCMVSQEHRVGDIKNRYPYIDFLFGTSMLPYFPQILYTVLTKPGRQFYNIDLAEDFIAEDIPVVRADKYKAWVSIMYGCNNFCTYCVVPYVRGRERSRDREAILEEVRQLAAQGYREITFLGQNVNSYKGGEDGYDFADLLSDAAKIEGDFTLRFMTSHPKDASKKLIDVMAREDKVAKHFHLPLQSGSDAILNKMNRRYTREKYLSLVSYMREKMPDIGITTDIIVGFPGESEEDFQGTLDMLEKAQFDNIYAFVYSIRRGTPAEKMPDQIPDKVKKERFARLLAKQNEISLARNKQSEGEYVQVLVEGFSKTDESKLTGRTEKGRLVHFEGDESLIGKTLKVKITKAETYMLFGELG